MLNNNFNNLFNRRNNNPQDGEFEDILSSILQQFSAETITECSMSCASSLTLPNESGAILLEEFIDQLLIALKTIFIADILVDRNNLITIKFSQNCQFKIKVSG